MELTMNMSAFEELDNREMMGVDGGVGILAAVGAAATKVATVAGAAVGLGPVGGGVLLGCCVVAAGVAIYAACNS